MSRISHIGSQTQITREIAEQLETAICKFEGIHVPENVQMAIDAIPFQIAAAEAIGSSSVALFELKEGVNFIIPDHIDPYKSERPQPEWLQGDVAIIFSYCVQAGLSPTLAPFAQPSSELLKSKLIIDWTHAAIDARNCARSGDTRFDLESLATGRIRIPYVQQQRVRERVSRVLAFAPILLYNARTAVRSCQSQAEILCINNDRHTVKDFFELRHDLEVICGLFGLTVNIRLNRIGQSKDLEVLLTVLYQAQIFFPERL